MGIFDYFNRIINYGRIREQSQLPKTPKKDSQHQTSQQTEQPSQHHLQPLRTE